MATLLYSAVKNGSSDLILTTDTPPGIRVDGRIHALDLPPLKAEDTSNLLYGILTPHQRIEFEEKRELDIAISLNLKKNPDGSILSGRFRVNAFHQRGSVGIVARVINTQIPDPEKLGLPPVLMHLASKNQGLILVTGPTGSGKSTTLASLVDYINKTRDAHIITIEDPIEYVHANKRSIIEQRELHADTLSYAGALKNALRQDPDVILVGEMRDTETMSAAITAAETGHLVLATIHTNNGPQTIDRIVDSFPDHQQNQIRLQLAGVLLGVISQRLLPLSNGSGRVAVFEIMVGTAPIQALVRDGKTHLLRSSMETGYKDGMVTMERALAELAAKNIVLPEEIAKLSC
ncbi:MAG: type IV pilus twitching motility protein PilT [Lentisphaeria bacterium]|nr:type IV pilus twitching motility protein PilT [Lentisphaeria bacterium]